MEVASSSSDNGGLVLVLEGFDRRHEAHAFLVVVWQGGASANLARVKREDRVAFLRVSVLLVEEDPSPPGCVRGSYFQTSTIVKTINDVIGGRALRLDVG